MDRDSGRGLREQEIACDVLVVGGGAAGCLAAMGARIINALGERYLERYHPWAEKAPRNVVVWAAFQEMKEGRGPCYVDCTHLPPETIGLIKLGIRSR